MMLNVCMYITDATFLNSADVNLPNDCKTEFVPKAFYWVSFERIPWLIGLGDAILLEKKGYCLALCYRFDNDNYPRHASLKMTLVRTVMSRF